MSELLKASGLKKIYGDGVGEVQALAGVDLTLSVGETLAVVGASGAGKSTLLHLLGGLDKPTAGSVWLCGKNLSEILKVESRYKTAAIYYYAHVAYQKNNLNTANEYFRKLDSSETFGPLIPYYVIQIKYEQKHYDEVISYYKEIEQRQDVKNRAEIDRYVAESYYGKGDYRQALKMFETFELSYRRFKPYI